MADKKSARFLDAAPASMPKRVKEALFGAPGQVELRITVTAVSDVDTYAFSFGGVPVSVPKSTGKGVFFATKGAKKLLEWVMSGEGGGTMKVVVTNGGTVVAQRDTSTIPPPGPKGYDAFEILVP